MEESEIKLIKESVEELLQKMTLRVFDVQLKASLVADKECVNIDVNVEDPQILIGQNGQTLFELSRLLNIILNKKISSKKVEGFGFYVDLDINDYKKKKIEYLKNLAKDQADEVALKKEKKVLPPMPSYERRIIHSELSERQDVITESQGEGPDRCIVIKPVD